MKYKVGDKVKFMDQKGGGIITRIVSTQVVHVMGDDGFEIPTLIKEILKIETDEKTFSSTLFLEPELAKAHAVMEPESVVEHHKLTALIRNTGKMNVSEGMYLAFVPHEQQWLLMGSLDIFILNNSSYSVSCQIFSKEGRQYKGIGRYEIPPYSKLLQGTIEREELNSWEECIIQVLFYKEQIEKLPLPVSNVMQIKGSRFFKENNYSFCSLLGEKTLLISIQSVESLLSMTSVKEMNEAPYLSENTRIHEETDLSGDILTHHMISETTAEVDLHIEAIDESPHLLEKNQILKKQISFFTSCMEAALKRNLQKIIFIHGVGNGVLKEAVQKELKNYKGLHWFDASRAKYGVGAIEILIGKNAGEL